MTVAALRVCGFSAPLMATITRLARTELWCPRSAAHLRPQKAARRHVNARRRGAEALPGPTSVPHTSSSDHRSHGRRCGRPRASDVAVSLHPAAGCAVSRRATDSAGSWGSWCALKAQGSLAAWYRRCNFRGAGAWTASVSCVCPPFHPRSRHQRVLGGRRAQRHRVRDGRLTLGRCSDRA